SETFETRSPRRPLPEFAAFQATGTTVAASTRGVSALSVISLRRNGISTTSAIPTARLPGPSSPNSFPSPALVATAVVPSPIGPPEQSRGVLIALRDARQYQQRAAR